MAVADKGARFWDRLARKYTASPISDIAGYERTLEATRRYLTCARITTCSNSAAARVRQRSHSRRRRNGSWRAICPVHRSAPLNGRMSRWGSLELATQSNATMVQREPRRASWSLEASYVWLEFRGAA